MNINQDITELKLHIDDVLKVDQTVLDEGAEYKYGFDLTDIKGKDWLDILKSAGLKANPTEIKGKAGRSKFIWKGKDVTLVTSNDPNGSVEKDYASYIGIKGDFDAVTKIAKQIEKKAVSIKGDEAGEESMYVDE
jgi:hypothetical protein